MSLDSFIGQYVTLITEQISEKRQTLEKKDFKKKSDFTKVQGQLQGLAEALQLLRSVPEED